MGRKVDPQAAVAGEMQVGMMAFRLPVPPEEYGAVRKVLEEKIRARVVNMEAGILGL